MKVVLFCHSLLSDWNHGNAHFLRGVVRELMDLGHAVDVWEPSDSWSRKNLLKQEGRGALATFCRAYPRLASRTYDPLTLDLDATLRGADLVLVHEWTDARLVARLNEHRRGRARYRILFHDTHHRGVTAPHEVRALQLDAFDGVLAFGEVLRELWLARGWTRAAWSWHEAADHRVFQPLPRPAKTADLVWIGNWNDGERADELEEFLIEPVRKLKLQANVYGVRYPRAARTRLASAGIEYRGWIANPDVPHVFAQHRATVHVPRRAYVEALPGIPTIRVFEALACAIPLVSALWEDRESLFPPGDVRVARDGAEMTRLLREVLADPAAARAEAERARGRLLERHTCRVRALELVGIACELGVAGAMHPEDPWVLAS